MDQNWYTLDLTPKPPKQKSYLWIWILGGCFMFFGFIVAVVLIVASQIPAGKDFGEWIAEAASQDNSQIVEFRRSDAPARLQTARTAFDARLTPADDVSSDEMKSVELFLQELTKIMQEGDDKAFESKFSVPEFKDRVRKANSISFTAKSGFRSQFDEWHTTFSPYSSSLSSIHLVSLKHDPADHTLIAYTWVFNSAYPDRVAWYLRSNGQQMRIVDYEILDTCQLESDSCARQFSAAFTGTYWNNFLEVLEYTGGDQTTSEGIDESKTQVQRMSKLTFPKSVAHEAYYRLATLAHNLNEDDLCLEMLVNVEKLADVPAVYWQRAVVFQRLKDYAKAEANLREYTNRLGTGPETYHLEAELATEQKQFDKANSAWINLLALHPSNPYIPWDFHHQMSARDGIVLARSIEARPDKGQAAQQIATVLVSRDRVDLAEPLIPIAESVGESTPELFALRAQFNQLQGNDDEYLRNMQSAWKTAAVDHPQRASWIYEWSSSLLNAGKASDAIQLSPNPGQTFFDLTLDEDGTPMLKLQQLQQLSDALQTANATDKSDEMLLQTWRRLAPTVVMVKQDDSPGIWQSLHALLKPDATADDKRIVEFLREQDQTWIIEDWISTAAVKASHIEDVWNLLPIDDRASTLIWKADGIKSTEAIHAIANLIKKETPESSDIVYCDALLARLNNDIPDAISNYQKYMRQPDFSSSTFQYSVNSSLADLAMKQPDWKTLMAEIPTQTLINTIASHLILKHRFDDAQAILELARTQGATFSSTVALEASILNARKDWQGLASLCDRQAAEVNSDDKESPAGHYVFGNTTSIFVDALLRLGNIQRAEEVLSASPADYTTATHKLKIAVMKGDQVAAEKLFSDAETESLAPPQFAQRGQPGDAIWSEEWRDFRKRHPSPFHAINGESADDTTAVLLLRSATQVTSDELQKQLQSVQPDVTVEDLTEQLRQQEARIIASSSTTSDSSKASLPLQAGSRQCFRVGLNGVTYLLFFGSDQYHAPVGSQLDNEADLFEANGLTDSLKQSIREHQGWMLIRQEAGAIADSDNDSNSLFQKLVAALSHENASVLLLSYQAVPMSDELRSLLQNGQIVDLPLAETFAISGTEPLLSALDAISAARLRALGKRLAETSENSEVPMINLILNAAGSGGRDQLLIEARLLSWEPAGFPTDFAVDLGDSPLLPATFRKEIAKANRWNILDWHEVQP